MSIDNLFNARKIAIKYTNEQKQALLKIHKFLESDDNFFLLAGYSGCGKTTLAENIANYKKATLLAPTNAAVNRLREKINNELLEYSTIHSALFKANDKSKGVSFTEGGDLRRYGVYIIDECSMIDQYILSVLIKKCVDKKCKMIFMGDSFQLEPVGKNPHIFNWEKAFPSLFLEHNKYELTEVKRYDGSLLNIATQIRTNKKSVFKNPNNSDLTIVSKFGKSLVEDMENNVFSYVVLTSTNKRRVAYNTKMREHLLKDEPDFNPETIYDGEVLVSVANSGGYSNGEIYTATNPIHRFSFPITIWNRKEESSSYIAHVYDINKSLHLIVPNLIEASLHGKQIFESIEMLDNISYSQRKSLISVAGRYGKKQKYFNRNITISTFGYAISCHKAQGQEWDNVYIDAHFLMPGWHKSKWFYTAITRAKNKVEITNNKYLKITE